MSVLCVFCLCLCVFGRQSLLVLFLPCVVPLLPSVSHSPLLCPCVCVRACVCRHSKAMEQAAEEQQAAVGVGFKRNTDG